MKAIEKSFLLSILLAVLGLLLIVFSLFIIVNLNDTYSYERENEKYNIKIVYKKTEVEELDSKIKDLIEEERNKFINGIEESLQEFENKDSLMINGEFHEYNELYFYNISVNSFTDVSGYNSKKNYYIFDNQSKKFTTISDMLKNEKSFTDMSLIAKHLLNIYAKEHKIRLIENKLNESISPIEKNYENSYLDNQGLNVIFPSNKLSNIDNEEIKIVVPWNKMDSLFKEKYQSEKTGSLITPVTRDISQYKNKKVIAFTFDDGPNTATTKILLDNLDKYDAKVTFFVLGSRINSNKDIIKRAYQDGNDIGSHTYSHKELTTLKNSKLKKEINDTNTEIKKVIGVEPVYLRPPYGSINDHIRNSTIMHTICWNIDSLDWKTKNRNKIKKEIVSHAKDGAIVLVHDIYKESVYGALSAMKELKKRGYSFVTITEMAELKNTNLEYDKTYYGF